MIVVLESRAFCTVASLAFMCVFMFALLVQKCLADRTARTEIGDWHDNIVCLSVTLCIVAKRYVGLCHGKTVNK